MNEKEKFVIEYLEREKFVDVLDVEFMRSFAMRFACKAFNMNHGAPRVPLASKTLSDMLKGGLLERYVVGMNSYAGGVGYPKWVYSYSLAKPNKGCSGRREVCGSKSKSAFKGCGQTPPPLNQTAVMRYIFSKIGDKK